MSTPAANVLDSAPVSAPVAPPVAAPSAPAANETFYSSWNNPDQKAVRDVIGNKNFADPFALAKSYVELEGQVGTLRTQANLKSYPADKVNPDGTVIKAEDNARKAWNLTMGVPETADKYELPIATENNPVATQFKTLISEAFLKNGVPPAMASSIANDYATIERTLMAQIQAQEKTTSEQQLLELQRAWGPNYQERIELSKRGEAYLAKEMGGMTDAQKRSIESALGTDKWMTMLWKIAAGNKEPGFAGGSGNPSTFGNSASAAQVELDSISAQRTAGTMSQDAFRKRADELIPMITAGMAPPNH